jgi:hypothetical protein
MLLLNILKANRWSYYPSPLGWDCIGAVFTLTGFMLALFSLISNGPGLQSVYFLKLIENPPTDLQITFGLYHYCIQDECIQDKSIMIVPFGMFCLE